MEWTEERRKAVGERLRQGRERKAQERASQPQPAAKRQPRGELVESEHAEATYREVVQALQAVNAPWLEENCEEHDAKSLIPLLQAAREATDRRIAVLEARRTQLLCGNPDCRRELPQGKPAATFSVHDQQGKILTWHACSEPCVRVIEGMQARIRQQRMSGNLQGVRAF